MARCSSGWQTCLLQVGWPSAVSAAKPLQRLSQFCGSFQSSDSQHLQLQYELGTAYAASIMPCSNAIEQAICVLEQLNFEQRHVWGQALAFNTAGLQSLPFYSARPKQLHEGCPTWLNDIAVGHTAS